MRPANEHPETPGRLVVVRHGSTDWSSARRHTGRTDRPLSDDGEAEARELKRRLEAYEPGAVYSSPLRRALDTCRLAGFGDGARIDADLVEWDYGEYEGLTFEQIQVQRPGWRLFDQGCPGGESPADVGVRADRFLCRLRDDPALEGRDVLCFAHGHLLRVLAARWLDLWPAQGRLFELDAAGIGILDRKRLEPVIERWNI